jgi:hypothetical protein
VVIDFFCDGARGWSIAERYGDDGRVALVHPLFDYPLIVPTYDLLTDTDVHILLAQANLIPSDFDGLYGALEYVKSDA